MHLHVTVDAEPDEVAMDLAETGHVRRPRGTKLTVIRLWDSARLREQVDVMLTLHCRPGEEYAKLADLSKWCALRRLPIVRRKIEADPIEYTDPPLYYETHVALPEEADPEDVRRIERAFRLGRSTNELRPRPGAFLTHRCADAFAAGVFTSSVEAGFVGAAVWPEAVIFDDNPAHDSWWVPTRLQPRK